MAEPTGSHRDIPDEVVKRAQLFDAAHWRQDRAGGRGGSWGSVPPDQVRRLLWGAYGGGISTSPAAHAECHRHMIGAVLECSCGDLISEIGTDSQRERDMASTCRICGKQGATGLEVTYGR